MRSIALIFTYLLTIFTANAWYDPPGSGTVIKEEPDPFWVAPQVRDSYDSFSVTEDVVNSNGFITREKTTFDCGPTMFGERTCRERPW